jgi:hypothetical protein
MKDPPVLPVPTLVGALTLSALTKVPAGAAIGAACWAALVPNWAPAAESPRGVNILFVLADDLGWADLSCYGGKFYESPHIDRLAKQGIKFTQAGLPKPDRESTAERRGQSRLVQDDPAYACEVAVLDDGMRRLSEANAREQSQKAALATNTNSSA